MLLRYINHTSHYCAMGLVLALLAGCGDCISIGLPSATLTGEDALSHASVSLAGATITTTSNGRPLVTSTLPQSQSTPYIICCATGPLRLQITTKEYLPVDTTVVVPSHGRCGNPDLIPVVISFRKVPA